MKPSLFLACAVAVIAVAGCNSKQGDAATNAAVNVKSVKPPKGGDWSQIVTATPQGGFLMGNPNAAVHLIEYGSLTCPHCREFDEKGVPNLINKYVKTGQVSWEFRNYVRDWLDLTATLIARCNGPKGFFPLSRALYEDQPNWVAKVQAAPQQQLETLQNLPPSQQFVQAAKIAGLGEWAAMRGVPQAKSAQCLANDKEINQLVEWTGEVTTQYPNFSGTPNFIINGKLDEKLAGWEAVDAALKQALGERG
jgi:protein-disulfide isomerase